MGDDEGEGVGVAVNTGWECPVHRKHVLRRSARLGIEYRGCPDCDLFERVMPRRPTVSMTDGAAARRHRSPTAPQPDRLDDRDEQDDRPLIDRIESWIFEEHTNFAIPVIVLGVLIWAMILDSIPLVRVIRFWMGMGQ